ncbi:hypothetical protein [Xenorhabdus sp. KK7.4]|uniref:hypothetical protein n=1 Tax=Xenorhabdus sp. KK7.4 TaxID=1851572 RepID=UPI000C049B5B|nr:hypothetical protein [Xenorhabdus sp. KK7.4]PHM52124.1 hypothetical protein Xekk_03349 [Xenorhabdus sp. KK7.4]
MKHTLKAKDLQALMTYNPNTGGLFWKARTPELYRKYSQADQGMAERSCTWFNQRYAGEHVGITMNGSNTYVRIAIGSGAGNIRKNILDLIWAVVTGKEPNGLVRLLDDNCARTVDNIVCLSPHIAQLFRNPRAGIYRNREEKTFYWRIYRGKGLDQQGGYQTIKEAREARDNKLKELGLWQETLLNDVYS